MTDNEIINHLGLVPDRGLYSDLKSRFEKFVFYGSPCGCHYWTGTDSGKPYPQQYGKFQILKKQFSAHRISYLLYKGEIPCGLCVCHSCDNRLCVNPDHLFLGTIKDNIMDMYSKNRQYTRRGSEVNTSKLGASDVLMIRRMAKAGATQTMIAGIYGVRQSSISKIVLNQSWGHI